MKDVSPWTNGALRRVALPLAGTTLLLGSTFALSAGSAGAAEGGGNESCATNQTEIKFDSGDLKGTPTKTAGEFSVTLSDIKTGDTSDASASPTVTMGSDIRSFDFLASAGLVTVIVKGGTEVNRVTGTQNANGTFSGNDITAALNPRSGKPFGVSNVKFCFAAAATQSASATPSTSASPSASPTATMSASPAASPTATMSASPTASPTAAAAAASPTAASPLAAAAAASPTAASPAAAASPTATAASPLAAAAASPTAASPSPTASETPSGTQAGGSSGAAMTDTTPTPTPPSTGGTAPIPPATDGTATDGTATDGTATDGTATDGTAIGGTSTGSASTDGTSTVGGSSGGAASGESPFAAAGLGASVPVAIAGESAGAAALPRTGGDVDTLLVMALWALGAGLVMVGLGKRRRLQVSS